MKSGIIPLKIDHRNYSTKTFGATFDFENDLNLDAGFGQPNQNADGKPNACTGYTQSELCQDEDKAQYKPNYTYEKTLFMMGATEGEPCDMKTSLKSTLVYGVQKTDETTDEQAQYHRRGAYYQVEKTAGDWFDSLRSIMQTRNCSVSVASPWYESFEAPMQGIILDNFRGGFSWHNWKCCGWKTINGAPYLIAKSWQGSSYGDGGYVYFSRSAINNLLSISGSGAFIVAQYNPSNVQTVSLSILETITSYLRMWLTQIISKPMQTNTSVNVQVPKEVNKPESKITLWARAIAEWEGDVTGHNAGNMKYTTLTKSWGATQGRPAQDGGYFAVFKDDGIPALCNFLTLGCENQLTAFHQARTFHDFTKVYAGNPPEGYIEGIRKLVGCEMDTDISTFLPSQV